MSHFESDPPTAGILRRTFVLTAGAVALGFAAGCSAPEPPPTPNIFADYPYVADVRDAVQQSDAVVVVEFVDHRSYNFIPPRLSGDPEKPGEPVNTATMPPEHIDAISIPTTESRVKVTESVSGDIEVGTIITIFQDGGTIDGVKHREASTSLLHEAGYRDFVLIIQKSPDGYFLVDTVLGVFGKDSDGLHILKPEFVENKSDLEIRSVQDILNAAR